MGNHKQPLDPKFAQSADYTFAEQGNCNLYIVVNRLCLSFAFLSLSVFFSSACQGVITGSDDLSEGDSSDENGASYRIGNFPGPDGPIRAAYVLDGSTAVVGGDMRWPINSALVVGAVTAGGPLSRWPGGIIPYKDEGNNSVLMVGIDAWNAVSGQTGITFVKHTTQRYYLNVVFGNGCHSEIGFRGGSQTLSLGNGCDGSTAIHELGHAIGMLHEHQRADRDSYIELNWGNVKGGEKTSFAKTNLGIVQGSTPYSEYDIDSIMHYRNVDVPDVYLIDTNTPLFEVVGDPGRTVNNQTLSSLDIAGVAAMYRGYGGQDPTEEPASECPSFECENFSLGEGECWGFGTGYYVCEEGCLTKVPQCGSTDPGTDPEPPPEPTFLCDNGDTIPETYLCDNISDCGDGSDEGNICGVTPGGDQSITCDVGQDVGFCIDTSTTTCLGELFTGYCPGGNEIRCCI